MTGCEITLLTFPGTAEDAAVELKEPAGDATIAVEETGSGHSEDL